jgi:hypothetical protein
LLKAEKEETLRLGSQRAIDLAKLEAADVELQQLRADLRESQVEVSEK